jgi:hypothetical protein
MGAHSHQELCLLPCGTLKLLAWRYKLSYASVSRLRMRFYLFDALELEALVAAHCKLSKLHRGYLSRQSFPDLHPPRPLHMQHSHYQ